MPSVHRIIEISSWYGMIGMFSILWKFKPFRHISNLMALSLGPRLGVWKVALAYLRHPETYLKVANKLIPVLFYIEFIAVFVEWRGQSVYRITWLKNPPPAKFGGKIHGQKKVGGKGGGVSDTFFWIFYSRPSVKAQFPGWHTFRISQNGIREFRNTKKNPENSLSFDPFSKMQMQNGKTSREVISSDAAKCHSQ